MGCTNSTPDPDLFEYCFPADPDVPLLGMAHGVKPSMTAPFELQLNKKSFQGKGGNSYLIRYRPAMKSFYDLEVKGKAGIGSKDQMDILRKGKQEPVAVLRRNSGRKAAVLDEFKIFSPSPLFPGQQPEIRYGEEKTDMYVYARVYEKLGSGGHIFFLRFENQEEPVYTCKRYDMELSYYIYYKKRQCAIFKDGTKNTIIAKFNPGMDPVLMVSLSAILDEID